MKDNRNTDMFLYRLLLFILALTLSVASCRREESDYDYFISNEHLVSYSESELNGLINLAITSYPGLEEIKGYVHAGINVFRMVYSTNINGGEIKASGLVCVPDEPGEYPVLSFQNGTNTLHSNAPSVRYNDPSYTLVEAIASMGFIVVIHDYPGFGSSDGIPHPYLIAGPTTRSVIDMLYALNEAGSTKFPGITVRNEHYLLGYSQGGWAALTLHKALELDYSMDFNLAGSACGAGSYNMYDLFMTMTGTDTYPMPSYLGYIINAYSEYDQFPNPVSTILNEPYSTRLGSLYQGTLSLGQINDQLTTSISGLFRQEFLSGIEASQEFAPVREALADNSISPWNSEKPLIFLHGGADTHVNVSATETMYDAMINAGTSESTCSKLIFPGLDHGDGVIPCMTRGIVFLVELRDQ